MKKIFVVKSIFVNVVYFEDFGGFCVT